MYKHYEKIICACCFLFIFVNVGFPSTSFNVYQPYIAEAVGDTAGSIILACRSLASLIGMVFVSRYYDRFGCRRGIFCATMLVVAGFLMYSAANTLVDFCVGAALSGLGYCLGGMVGMTTIIDRWFHSHVGVAVGIASAGSGLASLVIPPVVARLIEVFSLSTAFRFEAALAAVIGVLVCALLRNRPEDLGLEAFSLPIKPGSPLDQKLAKRAQAPGAVGIELPRRTYTLMLIAMGMLGAISINAYGFMSILLTTNGFDKLSAASLIALMGACLTIAKILAGEVLDLFGTLKGSALFFAVLLIGLALCCCIGIVPAAVVYAGVTLFGLGICLGTVGISVWSIELSTHATRIETVRNFQMAYTFGAFVFNFVPGLVMDLVGSYVPSYVMMLIFACVCAAITLSIYRRYTTTG